MDVDVAGSLDYFRGTADAAADPAMASGPMNADLRQTGMSIQPVTWRA